MREIQIQAANFSEKKKKISGIWNWILKKMGGVWGVFGMLLILESAPKVHRFTTSLRDFSNKSGDSYFEKGKKIKNFISFYNKRL